MMPERFFSLKSPCANCPFLKDKNASVYLRKGRREEIMSEVLSGENVVFHCHKTVYENTKGPRRVCAGAASLAKKMGGNMAMVQIAERMGVINADHYDGAHQLVMDAIEIGTGIRAKGVDTLVEVLKLNSD